MTLGDLTEYIALAFCRLDTSILNKLDENASYSFNYKEELIEELQEKFDGYKKAGISRMAISFSQCLYCYPKAKALSFYNQETDEFVVRYVIHEEGPEEFIVHECRNIPLPDGENGMPF